MDSHFTPSSHNDAVLNAYSSIKRNMAAASIPADIPKLKNLLDKGFRAIGWEVAFNQDPNDPKNLVPHTVVKITNGKDELELRSDDLKFSMFVSSMHHTRGRDAVTELRPFADLNKYWAEMEHLCVDHDKKRADAFKRIDLRQFKFSYDPQKLVKDFLATRDFPIPVETGVGSENAYSGRWHVAQATMPSPDRRTSKNSHRPSLTDSAVGRLGKDLSSMSDPRGATGIALRGFAFSQVKPDGATIWPVVT